MYLVQSRDVLSTSNAIMCLLKGVWNAIIHLKPRYKQCDPNLNPCQKVLSLMNATLFYWVTNKKAVTDVVDLVVYGEITNAPGKALEFGDDEEVDIDPPPREATRKTWAYTRTSFMLQRESEPPRELRMSAPT